MTVKKAGPNSKGMTGLRKKAEASLKKKAGRTGGSEGGDRERLLHELMRAEEEIRELNDALSRSNAVLEAANSELESFSYSVSHDLKAPLRTIGEFSHMLLQDYAGCLDEKAKGYLQHMHSASSKMDRLIDALLYLSRLMKSDLHIMDVNLTALAKEIAWELGERDAGRTVKFAIHEDLHARTDLFLLRTAVRNLFENAWKFTANAADARVEFGSDTREGETVYFVRDNGDGFDMKYADKLFKPFQRLHSEGDFSGTGIGLATVHRAIKMLGGRIWAESEPGRGATFLFTLGGTERASSVPASL